MLTYLLIAFFIYLIIYQFFSHSTKEGLNNYKNYNNNDASALAHKNAGNLQVVEGKLTKLETINDQVTKNTTNIDLLTKQVSKLTKHQQAAAVHALAAKKKMGGN